MSMSARERALYARDRCTCRYCDLSGMDNFDVWMNLSGRWQLIASHYSTVH